MTTTATATGDWRVAGRRPPACLRDIGLRRRRLTWCRSGGAVSSSICVVSSMSWLSPSSSSSHHWRRPAGRRSSEDPT
uniref:Uncharacterized protein n=1 Tax=Oryza punctata TaxID=4537 RepID=A0A0E0ME23_ORYPU